jgi:hypothetical protein
MTKKKNTSPMKKLLPAVGMLAISATMLGTSTYAWFTMNKEVEVTGMELKTKVGANLLICSDNVETKYSSEDLLQARMGLLEPVSSINGTTGSFWYTVNANARGQKESGATVTKYAETTDGQNAVAGKYAYDNTFNATYGIKDSGAASFTGGISMTKPSGSSSGTDGAAYGYIDYVFYLKATSDAATQDLRMTQCNLLYNDAAIGGSGTAGVDLDRAWRVGVFITPLDAATQGGKGNGNGIAQIDPANSAGNQKGIYALTNAAYFTPTQAQTSASALGDVVAFRNGTGDGISLATVTGIGTTAYYKVLVRVWLEGEDDTCNSQTYAQLTDNWSLNCKFELGQGTAVNGLNTDPAKKATGAQQISVTEIDVAKSGT